MTSTTGKLVATVQLICFVHGCTTSPLAAPTPSPTSRFLASTPPTRKPTMDPPAPVSSSSLPSIPDAASAALAAAPTAPTPAPTAQIRFLAEKIAPTPLPADLTPQPTTPLEAVAISTPAPMATKAMIMSEQLGAAIAAYEDAEIGLMSRLPENAANTTVPKVVVKMLGAMSMAQELSTAQAQRVTSYGRAVPVDMEEAGVQIDFPVDAVAALPLGCKMAVTVLEVESLRAFRRNNSANSSVESNTMAATIVAAMILNVRSGADYSKVDVAGLSQPIAFSIPFQPRNNSLPPQCMYFDETAAEWSDRGVTTVRVEDGILFCETTHLSLFGGVITAADGVIEAADVGVKTVEKVVNAAVQCRTADEVISRQGFRNLTKWHRWLSRPATCFLILMIIVHSLIIPWSFRMERLARERFEWTDDRWRIFVDDPAEIGRQDQSVWYKLADEIGLTEILEAKRSEVRSKQDGWLKTWLLIVTCRIAIVFVRSQVALDMLCTRICVRDFVRTMSITDHVNKKFIVTAQEQHMFAKSLKRADDLLTRERFSWLEAMKAMFIATHPWVRLAMFDCRVPASMRALGLAVSISGSFMVSALYFRQGATSHDSPPECTFHTLGEKFAWNCCVGVISLSVAWIPRFAINFFAQKRCVRVTMGNVELFERKMQEWYRRDAFLWIGSIGFVMFNLLYCFMFLATVSEGDAEDWFVSALASTTKSTVIAPIIGTWISACAAWVLTIFGARRARRAMSKATGLHFLSTHYAVMVQRFWRTRMARKGLDDLIERRKSSKSSKSSITSRGSVGTSGSRVLLLPLPRSASTINKLLSTEEIEERPASPTPPRPARALLNLQLTPFGLRKQSTDGNVEQRPRRASRKRNTANWKIQAHFDDDKTPVFDVGSPVFFSEPAPTSPTASIRTKASPAQPATECESPRDDIHEPRNEDVTKSVPIMPNEAVDDLPPPPPVGSAVTVDVLPFVSAAADDLHPPPRVGSAATVDVLPFVSAAPSFPSAASLTSESTYPVTMLDSDAFVTRAASRLSTASMESYEVPEAGQCVRQELKAKRAQLESEESKRDLVAGELEFLLRILKNQRPKDSDDAQQIFQVRLMKELKRQCCPKQDPFRTALIHDIDPPTEEQAQELLGLVVAEIQTVEGAVAKLQHATVYLNTLLAGALGAEEEEKFSPEEELGPEEHEEAGAIAKCATEEGSEQGAQDECGAEEVQV